ncbi:hypothetical protein KEM55_000186 [Ascosphaera atra]|nr:hypothetical protein KEM55_000186 [Ascosphaera atra]
MAVASAVELPVIDISQATPEAGKEMLNAAIEYGFLYVDSTSTEFSKKTVDEMFDLSRRFFKETPFAVKDRFRIGGNNRGWSGMHSETLDPEHQERGDFKEAMNFGEFKDGKPQQPVPDTLIPHESQIAKYHELCRTTCARILEILALGLGR